MFYDRPVFFRRNRVARVYTGGRSFSVFFGDAPEDGYYPEEWIVSDVRAVNEGGGEYDGISVIEDGDIRLTDALRLYPGEMLGGRTELGVLTKLLDSSVRLPMQAHPTRAFAKKYFGSAHGKEECWLIISTRGDASVYYGFRDGVTKEEFERAIERSETDPGAMTELVNRLPVSPGDVVYIPAGMVHAIGEGCFLLEVQEPTDFTIQPERMCGEYRLSDREMYLGLTKEQALECFDFTLRYPAPLKPKTVYDRDGVLREALTDADVTGAFSFNRLTLDAASCELNEAPAVYVVLEGDASLRGEGYERALKKGDYFLIPYASKGLFRAEGSAVIAEILPGE